MTASLSASPPPVIFRATCDTFSDTMRMPGRIGMCAVMALGAIAAVGGTQAAPPQATAQKYLL